MMPPVARLALIFAAAALCACSSSDSKGKSRDDTGPKYAQRSSRSNWSDKHRSSFEKQAEKQEKTKGVKTNSFHTQEYTNTKSAGGMNKKYHSKDFSQSDKKDSSLEKSFSGAKQESHLGSEQYKTSESRFDNQKNQDSGRMEHDSGKSYTESSRSYRTGTDAVGTTALQHVQKSKSSKGSYTEEEVRALLNKN